MAKTRISEKNPQQISRIDGQGCFIEILSSMFEQERVVINIEEHQKNAPYKRIAMNTFYLTFVEYLALSEEVKLGLLKRELVQAWQSNDKYKKIKEYQGGTSRANLAASGRSRTSGMDEYRKFEITPSIIGEDYACLQLHTGDGQQKDGKIIAPAFDWKDHSQYTTTRVPISYDNLRGVCALVDLRIQAFITAKQMRGDYDKTYSPPVQEQKVTPISSTPEERNQRNDGMNWGVSFGRVNKTYPGTKVS